ncbi:cobalt ABC transporter, ATP-binding protein [Eubacterium sp. 14-2]|uniref:energy-coupling factor ABC transporter ATP-binding protein n=1 Tax=Eubacterium sp. 14-2 TaxID=1235790 RepID=UPI00033B3A51|nr:ABC transporter ATP-binding protein [Eubacterium sp. 14-2]EOT24219.1 cobalt ABC transporter, ATP-binding protein [Eubacterium sp. 14-2]
MESGDIILQVQHLSYGYHPGNPVLKDVSVSVRKGEKVAVMGANGAGKSTFFLNLNGVLQAETGEIFYKGQKTGKKNLNELRRHVGFVFQDADSQIIASSVQAEVAFGPMNLKLSKEEVRERVDQALEYMDLQAYRSRPPHYLSGGEKKRVSIADIIAMHSEVILFDEPTAALDPLSADMLEEVLEKLSGEGKALLVSTHDVDFAYRWAERVLVFDQGQVIADGEVLSVFQEEAVLERAHLKKPELLTVYEVLLEKGLIRENSFPRQAEELAEAMDL